MKKMLIISCYENANQNYNEIPLLGWLESKSQTVASIGEDVEKSLLGMENGATTLKNILAFPQKVNHITII